MMSAFHLQGAVPRDSAAYVERPFENALYKAIVSYRWALLLGPRQYGKSSGLVRLQARLRKDGLACALVDLQAMPPCGSYFEVIKWFAQRTAQALGHHIDREPSGADASQLELWLERAIPTGTYPVIVVIDEASGIHNEEWRNSFYGQIRAIANERASAASDRLAARVTFLFSGCFRAETLVHNLNSPFNVCVSIELEDLELAKVITLNRDITGDQDETFVRKAYDLVGGQPYLLQFILSNVQATSDQDKNAGYDRAIVSLRNGEDNHLSGVFRPVLAEARLAGLVAVMAKDGRIANEPANPDFKYVQILGVAKRDGTNLIFRNRLYAEFAITSSQLTEPPSAAARGFALIAPRLEDYTFVKSNEFAEFAYSMELGAVRAYNSGSYRLALVGFGSALEGILMHWLSTLSAPVIAKAVADAKADRNRATFDRYENETKPETWHLVNLIKVARKANPKIQIAEPSENLREWRSIVHPIVAQRYVTEDKLEPEARQASGFLAAVKRDVASII